ncbi:hypothetical protein BC834DRAFT_556285 [Gloeopeniophorella convolvens]|nr:hypothetical protein BC834DRAFT_556285 [Gloeopeniophorella convolvens]
MPRYRSRRRVADAMSDGIEEDAAPQHMDEDAVDEEDEDVQPRPPRRTVTNGTAANNGEAQDGFDEESFGNQPLDRHEGQKLQGIALDWNMIATNLKDSAFSLLTEVSGAVAEYADDDDVKEQLDNLDHLMKDIIDIDVEILSHERTLKDLHQKVISGEKISDVLERYEKQVDEKLDTYRNKTSRQKYAKSEAYAAFKQSVYHPDEAMPPVIEFLPREEGDISDDEDDDIQVGGVLQDFNCPITLVPLEEPLTSSICQHSFSAAAIRQMLGPNRYTKKICPASGCNQMICINDLRPDKDLERRVKAYQRRARQREEDPEAEEIVE